MRVSIIGSGIVGQNHGKELAKEHDVIFFDINKQTLEKLRGEGYNSTESLSDAIMNSEISFIAVPTPTDDSGRIDLSFIELVSKNCAEAMEKKSDFHVFVVKSTTVPGTTEKVVIPNLESQGKKHGVDFGVLYNPEFLTEIHQSWSDNPEFTRKPSNEERIVIGEGEDKKAGDSLEQLYKYLDIPVFRMNYKTAELIKYTSNARLATAISFFNEIWFICRETGIDSQMIADIIGMDKRIGKYGTVHGKAYGGKCLPKDLAALISYVKENTSYDPTLLRAVEKVNNDIKEVAGVRE